MENPYIGNTVIARLKIYVSRDDGGEDTTGRGRKGNDVFINFAGAEEEEERSCSEGFPSLKNSVRRSSRVRGVEIDF